MVNEEMAMILLMMGVGRRQAHLGVHNRTDGQDVTADQLFKWILRQALEQSVQLTPSVEKQIVEPLEKALAMYQTLGNHRQTANAHYQIASFYSRVWIGQTDR